MDHMDSKVTKELTATDLIMISTNKRTGIRVNNQYAASKYAGRWFEYVDPTDKSRICVVLNSSRASDIPEGVVGTIYGEKGSLWKDVVIADESQMARNYFKLYQDERIKNSALAARVDALQRLVNKMQNDLDTFHKEEI